MSGVDLYVALALGIGLAAASGFRVFIPPFLYGLATRFELNPTALRARTCKHGWPQMLV